MADADSQVGQDLSPGMQPGGTWAPFRYPAFRAIWVANLASNLGATMQSVGAAWEMTSLTPSHQMIALIQASTTIPIMVFGVFAGAIADNFDRRRVMLLSQFGMLLASIALTVLTYDRTAGEWRASGNLVALVSGLLSGLASAVGAMIGGYICDRIDATRAYLLFGLTAGLAATIMAWAPRAPEMFAVFVLAYALATGAAYAGYSAVVLQAIGKRSVATNFSLMAALSNIPIAAMTEFDGLMHDRFGTAAMLYGELALPVFSIVGFALLVMATRRRARG